MIVDANRHAIVEGADSVKLSPMEFTILQRIIKGNGAPVADDTLILNMYPYDNEPDTSMSALRVRIHHIRRKMRSINARAKIETITGVGIRYETAA